MKPRCRWRIGDTERLAPYRLKVYLAENKRIDGKVKQETVAFLGSIDGALLDSFWDGVDPGALDKLRSPDWERQSISARVAFWQSANPRLKRLVNRLGPDAKAMRLAVHARIPWPMEVERNRLELLEAKSEVKFWGGLYKLTTNKIERTEKIIKTAERRNVEERKEAMRLVKTMAEWGEEVKRLKRKPVGG